MKYIDAKRLLTLCVEHGLLQKSDDGFIPVFVGYTKENLVRKFLMDREEIKRLMSALSKSGIQMIPISMDDPYDVERLLDIAVQQGILETDEETGNNMVIEYTDEDLLAQDLMQDETGQKALISALAEKGVQFEEIFDKMFPAVCF